MSGTFETAMHFLEQASDTLDPEAAQQARVSVNDTLPLLSAAGDIYHRQYGALLVEAAAELESAKAKMTLVLHRIMDESTRLKGALEK